LAQRALVLVGINSDALTVADTDAVSPTAPRVARASFGPADELNGCSPYKVVVDPKGLCVEAWSSKRLPYKPKGWLASLRAELRGTLPALYGGPDHVLAAVYGSPDPAPCDVENVLLYNVGAHALRVVAAHGLRLERSYGCPEPPAPLAGTGRHYVRYCCSPRAAGFQAWTEERVLASWSAVPMPALSEATKPAAVWFALAAAEVEATQALGPQEPFGLRLKLEVPRTERVAPAKIVKPLVDGTISALHCHDGRALAEISRRLVEEIEAPGEKIAARLMDDRYAVLGSRRLLWPRAEGVQWNPADDRCVALGLQIDRGDRLCLSGRLFAVAPSPVAQSRETLTGSAQEREGRRKGAW
jgi:hypothetical protein